jgi:hypothetical protein
MSLMCDEPELASPMRARWQPSVPQAESARIGAAIEHINEHGNLDGFPAARGERAALVLTARRQGLVAWSRTHRKYELTIHGYRTLRSLQPAGRTAMPNRLNFLAAAPVGAMAGSLAVAGVMALTFNALGLATFGTKPDAALPAASAYVQPTHDSQGMATAAAKSDTAGPTRAALLDAAESPTVSPSGQAGPVEVGPSAESGEPTQPATVAMIDDSTAAGPGAAHTKNSHKGRDQHAATKVAHKHSRSPRWYQADHSGYRYGGNARAQLYGYWSAPSGWYQ